MSKFNLSCSETSWLTGILEEFLDRGRDYDFTWSLSSDDIKFSKTILEKIKSRSFNYEK